MSFCSCAPKLRDKLGDKLGDKLQGKLGGKSQGKSKYRDLVPSLAPSRHQVGTKSGPSQAPQSLPRRPDPAPAHGRARATRPDDGNPDKPARAADRSAAPLHPARGAGRVTGYRCLPRINQKAPRIARINTNVFEPLMSFRQTFSAEYYLCRPTSFNIRVHS